MKFEYNLGFTEIVARMFLGMALCILGGSLAHFISAFFIVFSFIGFILIITAILGWCPIYDLMGKQPKIN